MSSKKAPKNKYVTKLHLSERKFRELPRLFRADVTALSAAPPDGPQPQHGQPPPRHAPRPHCGGLRGRQPLRRGARSGRPGRPGPRGEAIVSGLPKRGGKVCTRIVPDVTRGTSTRVIEGKASKDPIMCTDGFAPCDGLVGWGCERHCRVSRGENGFVERGNPGDRIDGIEGFWGYAKDRLVKYQGVPEEDFYLHLKECEFRFSMRGRDMYRFMLRELRERPLN